jgi:peptidoglycan/xylan/chitin deacetylase (PgdA/CDA1 family)
MERRAQIDPDLLHARREARRRELTRRRRAVALVGLAAVVIAVAAVLTLTAGGSSTPSAVRDARVPATAAVRKGSARRTTAAGGSRGAVPAGTGAVPGTEAVPILMYHVINPAPAGAPFPGLYVPTAEFAEQMHALSHAGFHAVTLDQLWANWEHGTPLPPGKPIVLSFDNGYQSQYTNALPVLRRLGWEGVENLQLTGLPPSQGGLSPAQVRGLLTAGWELDTQGFSHADLITLSPAALHYQVAVARTAVQRLYHVPVNWFCYPSGHYNAAVVAAVQAAGYRGSTTVVPGWAHSGEDPYRLPRLRVLGATTGPELLDELAGIRVDSPPPASYGTD